MPSVITPSVITGNVLRTGAIVYLKSDGTWTEHLADATPALGEATRTELEKLALAAVEHNELTGVYAFDVAIVGGRPAPLSVREKIRAVGAPAL